jgi:hypothetical protein
MVVLIVVVFVLVLVAASSAARAAAISVTDALEKAALSTRLTSLRTAAVTNR